MRSLSFSYNLELEFRYYGVRFLTLNCKLVGGQVAQRTVWMMMIGGMQP